MLIDRSMWLVSGGPSGQVARAELTKGLISIRISMDCH